MILPTLHELLVSSTRITTTTNKKNKTTTPPLLLLLSEEEEDDSIKPTPVTPTPPSTTVVVATTVSSPFPDSDASPSRYYNYSVGPLAHGKSEGGRTSKKSCWKLRDFTPTTDNGNDDAMTSHSRSSTSSSSHLGEGKFGTVQLYKHNHKSSSSKNISNSNSNTNNNKNNNKNTNNNNNKNNNNKLVAIKTMGKSNSNDRLRLLWKREVEIQTRLSHSNIIHCFGYFQTSSQLHMVLEYASLGNLTEYANDNDHHRMLTRTTKIRFVRHVTTALAHLASQGIAHRDVKTENVLICRDSSNNNGCCRLTAKLADFGYAINCHPNNNWRTTLCGTLACLSPEMIQIDNHNNNNDNDDTSYYYNAMLVDAWSLGVLAYELVMDAALFDSIPNDRDAIKKAITRGFDPDMMVISDADQHQTLSSTNDHLLFGDLLSKLLDYNPKRRLMPAQALQHEWMLSLTTTDNDDDNDANKKKSKKRRALKKEQPPIKKGIKRRRRRRRRC
mmetsp:Transcript_19006/g.31521  ORF Transcript_19006/g.31521 Transcript_19006/m.31521 type:complete len:500 (-) Transcript_19006:117-1616(-)